MSARDDLIDEYGRADTEPLGTLDDLRWKLGTIRAEVRAEALAEAKAEVVAWLSKKSREQVTWRADVLASKVERGAIRSFLVSEQVREKATAPAATATPGPTGRVAALLAVIRMEGGAWTIARTVRFYRAALSTSLHHLDPKQIKRVARGDLRDLHTGGYLAYHDEPGKQFYTYKGGRRA